MSKHSHYYKDVSHLNEIDVYQVCQLFGIDDPSGALQHAIKKLLVAGGRGAGKSKIKDLSEAVDSINRLIVILSEPGVRTILGMNFAVSQEGRGCNSMKEVEELSRMGATAVMITAEFHHELMRMAIYPTGV